MSEIIIHRRVANYARRLPAPKKARLKELLKQLQHEPLEQPQVRQMMGNWVGYYRIRLGNLRIIFWYDADTDTVYVDYIGARGDIYK